MKLFIRRVYDEPSAADGVRVLVDRLWPRGISKESAGIDLWLKEVTPSSELRLWFHEKKAERLEEFQKRYLKELRGSKAVSELRKRIKKERVTLVSAVKDLQNSHLPVLVEALTSSGNL